MAITLTESRLRQIIREEAAKLSRRPTRNLREGGLDPNLDPDPPLGGRGHLDKRAADEHSRYINRIGEPDGEEDFEFYRGGKPGMQGMPDAATVADMIIEKEGGDASQLYKAVMRGDHTADAELKDYIDDFGGGALTGDSESDVDAVLAALAPMSGMRQGR